ncbi:B3 domain-containing transcription factor VRN1 [Morella rubra]|uniref:B3 domain-containing transcription factor VRN1 n=1 Tax=Morella rubra TaxID=262757 RepID=A0A6A1V2L0_9ROSI|nr:B3 domain-containing transcription factor VRN1 [Morella rubra]
MSFAQRLPEKFVSKFGDELSTVAILTVPNGCTWQVGLEKADKKIWFHDGWKDFVEHHSILHGYFLVFKYEGNSKFHVLIFDMTATEIQYPSDGNDKRSKRLNSEYQNDIKESRQCQVNDNEMSSEHELPAKCEGDKEKFWRKSSDMFTGRKFEVSRGRERAIQAATKLKTRNPFFISTIRPYNLYNSFLRLPAQFAKKYLSGLRFVRLEASDGKQYHVRCCYGNTAGAPSTMGKGWTIFCRANHLKEGDICVFELIKREEVVLKISILRSDEYAGM